MTVGEFSMNVANSLVIYYTHVDLLKTEPMAVGRIFLAHAPEVSLGDGDRQGWHKLIAGGAPTFSCREWELRQSNQ